jgi:archaemetzincin
MGNHQLKWGVRLRRWVRFARRIFRCSAVWRMIGHRPLPSLRSDLDLFEETMLSVTLIPFRGVDPDVVSHLVRDLNSLGFAASVASPIEIPERSYNPQRRQYDAEAFLAAVREFPGARLLGIAKDDLFVESLNFVFGLAERPGKAAVISLYRLQSDVDAKVYRQRIVKEAVHELGHTLGLNHCPQPDCVMHFSNSLRDTDRKDIYFCAACRRTAPAVRS